MSDDASSGKLHIETAEYESFADFLRSACGISLGANKQYLVATRMRRILTEHKLASLTELTLKIARDQERGLRQQVIDAMTTNETFWFRDNYPFDYLAKTLLPELAQRKSGIRIWSAACSTGQEPYSISMVVEESLRTRSRPALDVEILATDLSSAVLDTARLAQYDKLSLARGLVANRMEQFFQSAGPDLWVLRDNVRSRVRFRPFNLQDSCSLLGKFDVIFCRNVLIYFSSESKQKILTRLHAALNPGGVLFLGSSESVSGVSNLFDMINCNPGVAYRAR